MSSGSSARPTIIEVWFAEASRQLAAEWRNAVPEAALRELAALRDVERERRVVQLALRRSVLAASSGRAIDDVPLIASADGRIASPLPGLVLSASHHDDMTVLALAEGPRALGVDVEPVYEPGWEDAIADVLSADELRALMVLPESDRPAAYFTCWTLKEAVMKALGEGLSERDPASVEVTLPPSSAELLALDGRPPSTAWRLATVELGQHVCSLAVVHDLEMRVRSRRWPVDLPPAVR
jgi:4'-phosphopantetheinyl transferase